MLIVSKDKKSYSKKCVSLTINTRISYSFSPEEGN